MSTSRRFHALVGSVLTLLLLAGEGRAADPFWITSDSGAVREILAFPRHPPMWVMYTEGNAEDYLANLPEFADQDRWIRQYSGGEAHFIFWYELRTGDQDTDIDPKDCWDFYVGEEHEDHYARIDTFFVKDDGQVWVGSPGGPWVSFAEWRRHKLAVRASDHQP